MPKVNKKGTSCPQFPHHYCRNIRKESPHHTQENHQGRVLPQQWVFGGTDRQSRECFMYTARQIRADSVADYPTSDCTGYNNRVGYVGSLWWCQCHGIWSLVGEPHIQFCRPSNWCSYAKQRTHGKTRSKETKDSTVLIVRCLKAVSVNGYGGKMWTFLTRS